MLGGKCEEEDQGDGRGRVGVRVEGQCEMQYPGTTLLRKGPVRRHKGSEEASHEDIWRKRIPKINCSYGMSLLFFSEKQLCRNGEKN